MKMNKILKIPLRRLSQRPPPAEALRAKAAANPEPYDDEDFDSGEEPNMKFSHALVVVLALHVIAVGGVFAFNSIKAGQSSITKSSLKGENAPPAPQSKSSSTSPAETKSARTHTVQPGDTLSRLASLYKVSVETIEKENGITSYSMIRVGQVLKIPASEVAAGKSEPAKPPTDPATAAAKHAFLAARTDIAKQPATVTKPDAAKPAPDAAKPPPVAAKPAPDTAKPPPDAAKPAPVAAKPLPVAASTPKPAHPQPSATKVEATPAPAESDTYVVAKGDNPYSIAKKLKVSYNELIAINEIKDPTRVQIGQKLKIPAKKN
jgi:LysM repeat protein